LIGGLTLSRINFLSWQLQRRSHFTGNGPVTENFTLFAEKVVETAPAP
jgi:hypothetical protein